MLFILIRQAIRVCIYTFISNQVVVLAHVPHLASSARQEFGFFQPIFSALCVCLLIQQFCFSVNAVQSVCGSDLAVGHRFFRSDSILTTAHRSKSSLPGVLLWLFCIFGAAWSILRQPAGEVLGDGSGWWD